MQVNSHDDRISLPSARPTFKAMLEASNLQLSKVNGTIKCWRQAAILIRSSPESSGKTWRLSLTGLILMIMLLTANSSTRSSSDINAMPFEDNSYNLVSAVWLLEHVNENSF